MVCLLATSTFAAIELTPAQPDAWEKVHAGVALEYLAAKVSGEPKIDGVLDDAVWQGAAVADHFALQRATPVGSDKWVKARLITDGQSLFVAGELVKPDGALSANVKTDFGRVWRDHSFELFIHRPEKDITYQLVINANGVYWSGSSDKTALWRPAVTVAATVDSHVWRFELKLPWRDLGFEGTPTTSVRMQMRYMQPEGSGWTSWSPSDETAGYGLLSFGGARNEATITVRQFLFPTVMPVGENVLSAELVNPDTKPRKAIARIFAYTPRGVASVVGQQIVELKPGETRRIDLTVSYDGSEPFDRVLAVRDWADGDRWPFFERRLIRAVAPLRVHLDRERVWVGDHAITGHAEVGVDAGARATAALEVELWDSLRRIADAQTLIGASRGVDLNIPIASLPAGAYRMVVRVAGTSQPREQVIDLRIGQDMALPARHRVPLVVSWPEGSTYDQPVPMYAGVSFPAGAVIDPNHIRLINAKTGAELPVQTQTLATWGPKGSVKWLGTYFVGRRGESYAVEFGSEITRAAQPAKPVRVDHGDKVITIDTGAARFELPRRGPLIGRAWIGDRQMLQGDQGCLIVADQNGQIADETRGEANEAPTVEMAGPLQVIVKREGLLRTAEGRRLGKYVVRMTFTSGVSFVPIQHSFIITEDTNQTQFSDLAFRVNPAAAGPWRVALDTSPALDGRNHTLTLDPAKGEGAYMLQSVYPHHRLPDSKFTVGVKRDGKWSDVETGEVAGQWGAVWTNAGGVALTRRHLQQMFPGEIEVGSDGVTAHLWSSRGGRLLDYRPATIAEYVGKAWVDKAYPGGSEAFGKIHANAVSSARTSELCLHLFSPEVAPAGSPPMFPAAEQVAWLAEHPVLVIQDPQWLRQTNALGPVRPRDPDRFPRVEAFADRFFQHCLKGQVERFGDHGFLDYGAGPHTYGGAVENPGADFPRLNYRYSNEEYQMRTSIWLAYARSGDRDIFDYAQAINRHIADFKFSHFDAKGKPLGALTGGYGSEESMLYWQGIPGRFPAGLMGGHQGFDIENFFNQYFLTGDRAVMDAVHAFGERFISEFDPLVLPNVGATSNNSHPYGFAALLYGLTWDTRFARMAQACRDRLIDLDTTTGLVHQDYYGAHYKVHVRMWAAAKDYQITGAHVAAQALVKYAQSHTTGTPGYTTGYQDHDGIFLQIAYDLTGDQRYIDWMHGRLMRLAHAYTTPDGELKGTPYVGTHSSNIFETIVYGLDLIARSQKQPGVRPLFTATDNTPGTAVYFFKPDRATLDLEVTNGDKLNVVLQSLASVDSEKLRFGYTGPVNVRWNPGYYGSSIGFHGGHASVHLPAEAIGGIYRLDNPGSVMVSGTPQIVLTAPQGVTLDGAMVDTPPYWFRIPAEKAGSIFVSKSARLTIGDDTVALEGGKWNALPAAPSDRDAALYLGSTTFVRFAGDIPPILARSREGWFMPRDDIAAQPLEDAAPIAEFGQGLTGKPNDRAFMLGGARGLTVLRGDQISNGVYEFFNTERGTMEFWIKPRWSASLQTQQRDRTLFGAGQWHIAYHERQGDQIGVNNHITDVLFGNNHFILLVNPGNRGIYQRLVNPVNIWQDQWYHIAHCWETREKDGWVSEFYVNGKPSLNWNRVGVGLSRFNASEDPKAGEWRPAQPAEKMLIPAQFDGWIDELRISDVVRYPEPFDAIKRKPFDADEYTLLLMHFDGDTNTITPRSVQ